MAKATAQDRRGHSRTPYAGMIRFRFKGCFSARTADAPVAAVTNQTFGRKVKPATPSAHRGPEAKRP